MYFSSLTASYICLWHGYTWSGERFEDGLFIGLILRKVWRCRPHLSFWQVKTFSANWNDIEWYAMTKFWNIFWSLQHSTWMDSKVPCSCTVDFTSGSNKTGDAPSLEKTKKSQNLKMQPIHPPTFPCASYVHRIQHLNCSLIHTCISKFGGQVSSGISVDKKWQDCMNCRERRKRTVEWVEWKATCHHQTFSFNIRESEEHMIFPTTLEWEAFNRS